MRTTVTIDDDLLRRARILAAETGRSLGDIVDDALRILFLRDGSEEVAAPVLPTYGGSGLQPGVDLEDKDALAVLLGDEDRARAAR
jgi:hypothetical protein